MQATSKTDTTREPIEASAGDLEHLCRRARKLTTARRLSTARVPARPARLIFAVRCAFRTGQQLVAERHPPQPGSVSYPLGLETPHGPGAGSLRIVEFQRSGESHNCVTQLWGESKYAPLLMRHPERHDEDDRVREIKLRRSSTEPPMQNHEREQQCTQALYVEVVAC